MKGHPALALLALLLSGTACSDDAPARFELLEPEATGIDFVNELPEDPAVNIINYLYYYNGGGVAAGDVNGDGLSDLYLTSNLGTDRLYLNRGGFRFEDVTERAGVGGAPGWTTGATMADVNGDGHLDIYVLGVNYLSLPGRNILYINNGDATFTDRTAEYGLEHSGYSTQALFADFDADGDLDMYLLNQSTHEERMKAGGAGREVPHPRAGDRLFRNEGGRFRDVTAEAGIYSGVEGYGLGVVASDLNLDGCLDLYVANDFQENDFLYLNDCDGTFTEALSGAMGHTSRFSMGADAADFNNDARPDLFVADMMPVREEILKSSAGAEPFNVAEMRRRAGYHPQYSRNVLQLNRGAGRFSEIGFLAGVHATDWSWAALFADLDNDGFKDLFVTNGIVRRPNDLDYISYVGGAEVQASLARGITQENLRIVDRMPSVPIPNHAFRNNGDLTFADMAEEWGLAQPGFSSGAAYVDLDNDGALDLVVNNIDAPVGIYRNRSREMGDDHYLRVRLHGEGANTGGIGAKVIVRHDRRTQMLEQVPTRGFQSAVDATLHFGLGASAQIDTLLVIWPDRRFQLLTNLPADTTLTLTQAESAGRYEPPAPPAPLFEDVSAEIGPSYAHQENPFFDYNREPLMPHRLSTEGPALAVADVDGNGLDDLFVGGAKWQAGRLFLQQANGSFVAGSEVVLQADSLHEDVDAAFFDANGDGHPDLYVVSGGNEFWGEHDALRDRLYLNDGNGGLRRAEGALPDLFANGACVAPGDFDGDGDLDLFVGSRVVARRYGEIPRSVLLMNDGAGRFSDVTDEVAPELATVGMVTDAAWVRSAEGSVPELVVVGEWMPVRVFRVEGGKLVDRTDEAGLAGTEGWWNSVTAVDLDGGGPDELVLGNLGLNSYIRASADEPARLYVADFAGSGSPQQILTFYKGGVSYPMAGRDELIAAIPQLRERYPTYASFGASRVEEIIPGDQLDDAAVLEARTFASAIAMRDEEGRYRLTPLPVEAQVAPIQAAVSGDFDGDGVADLVVAGNMFGVPPVRGRYDASYGLLLRGSGDGRLEPVELERSGLVIDGEVRALAAMRGPGGARLLVAAMNGDSLRVVRSRQSS